MFKQQKKAAGYIPRQQLNLVRVALRRLDYEEHPGPAVTRDGEVITLRRSFSTPKGWRQNHVQIVERGNSLAVYAHTEPHTDAFVDHAISAVFDGASFAGGSKMVRADLAKVGIPLSGRSDAAASGRRAKRSR